jgi:hypothetical protein
MGKLWRWNGTGPVLALEPLSTILPGNYRHLQHLQALDRPTLFLTPFLHTTTLGDYSPRLG